MTVNKLNRRDFFRIGMAAGAAFAVSSTIPIFSMAGVRKTTLNECMEMSPEQMARSSKMVMDSWQYILDTVKMIENHQIRSAVQGILDNPAPTLMIGLTDEKNKRQVYEKMKAKAFVPDVPFESFLPAAKNPNKSPHPFIAGPGSGYSSHHSYPGGLVTHTAMNLIVSLSIYEGYQTIYGYSLNRDVVIASQVLHDLHKPWVFQWGENGESRTERKLAGTGEHHSLGVAESIHRGLPADVCVAQACAHNHPGWKEDEAGPVNWITAACITLDRDPVAANMLASDGKTLPLPRRIENFVCHLGDHDWVLSVPAAEWLIPVMKQIAVDKYKMAENDLNGKRFNQFRNYVFSQASIMYLYETFSRKGETALEKEVMSIVTPA
jgi:hypothetical protein